MGVKEAPAPGAGHSTGQFPASHPAVLQGAVAGGAAVGFNVAELWQTHGFWLSPVVPAAGHRSIPGSSLQGNGA